MTHFYYEESIKIAQKNQCYKNQSDTNQHNKESLSMDLIVYLYLKTGQKTYEGHIEVNESLKEENIIDSDIGMIIRLDNDKP